MSEGVVRRLLTGTDRGDAVPALVSAALAAGGRDNVTCVVADLVEGERVSTVGTLLGAVCDLSNVVDPVAVRAPRSA